MSFVTVAAVQQIAESLTVTKLSQDASKALAPHIDVRLREIIQEACKFSRHSKRSALSSEDVNNALRFYSCEPLYGFSGKDPSRFVRAAGQADLYYIEDLEVPTKQVIEKPLPKVPIEVGVVAHWLAINGVQPRTAEHAPIDRRRVKRQRLEAARPVNTKAGIPEQPDKQPEGGEPKTAAVIPPIRQVLSAELQVYHKKVQDAIDARLPATGEDLELSFQGWPSAKGAQLGTKEPSLAASRLVNERALLASLADDPGIHPLAPALVELIIKQVKQSMKHLQQLRLLISIAHSMLRNQHIELELYLHKLISPLMTCLVTKRIGISPWEDHWAVRSAAADAIASVCRQYGDKYVDLQPRICKQLVKALTDPSKPVTTLFGAIIGLMKLGNRAMQMFILPNVPPVMKRLEGVLNETSDKAVRADVGRLQGMLCLASTLCVNNAATDIRPLDRTIYSRKFPILKSNMKLDFRKRRMASNHDQQQPISQVGQPASLATLASTGTDNAVKGLSASLCPPPKTQNQAGKTPDLMKSEQIALLDVQIVLIWPLQNLLLVSASTMLICRADIAHKVAHCGEIESLRSGTGIADVDPIYDEATKKMPLDRNLLQSFRQVQQIFGEENLTCLHDGPIEEVHL